MKKTQDLYSLKENIYMIQIYITDVRYMYLVSNRCRYMTKNQNRKIKVVVSKSEDHSVNDIMQLYQKQIDKVTNIKTFKYTVKDLKPLINTVISTLKDHNVEYITVKDLNGIICDQLSKQNDMTAKDKNDNYHLVRYICQHDYKMKDNKINI